MAKQRFTVIPAVYILFRHADKILLMRRAGTGYHDGDYSLPAGHLEGNETALAAAIRETEEEVGIKLDPADMKLLHTMHRYSEEPVPHERIDLYFEAMIWGGEPRIAEPHKCDELRWISIDKLPSNMVPEVALALKKITTGEPYADYNFKKAA